MPDIAQSLRHIEVQKSTSRSSPPPSLAVSMVLTHAAENWPRGLEWQWREIVSRVGRIQGNEPSAAELWDLHVMATAAELPEFSPMGCVDVTGWSEAKLQRGQVLMRQFGRTMRGLKQDNASVGVRHTRVTHALELLAEFNSLVHRAPLHVRVDPRALQSV